MITDDFIDPEHTGKDRELLRTFYEACHADGGTADESTLRGIRAVLAFAAADRPAAVAPAAPTAGQRQPLSPAAQAVLDAVLSLYSTPAAREMARPLELPVIAATIRALADQVVPAASSLDRATWSPFAGQIRSEILAIAAELEGADG